MTDASTALAQSIQTRLLRHARTVGVDPNLVLTRFAAERLLYRLSRSPHAERFVLKGAFLLLVWLGETIRPTRDVDLLGFGNLADEELARIFREVCSTAVDPDAMVYLPDSIRIAAIRPEDRYGGKRVALEARLGRARLRVQVDVGVGDAVTPEPVWLEYPSLLGLPPARLRAYRPETAIAEKVHAMVTLGSKNSRMRDFFDIDALAQHEGFKGEGLVEALGATFARRRTPISADLPLALTPAFAESGEKQAQWAGFLKKNHLSSAPPDLGQVIERLVRFLGPPWSALAEGTAFTSSWRPGGPWEPAP